MEPRLSHAGLEKPAPRRRIFEHTAGVGAVPAPFMAELLDCGENPVFLETEETLMIQRFPIHDLLAHLETERLKAIQALAAKPGALPADALQGISILQTVLTAVREEIAAHEVKVGRGDTRPLE